jgi:hypothetical protein
LWTPTARFLASNESQSINHRTTRRRGGYLRVSGSRPVLFPKIS